MKQCSFFLILMVLVSCGRQQFSSEDDLWDYLNDESNGYMQEKTIHGIDFRLVYKPTDLLVKQSYNGGGDKEIDSLRKKYSQYLYFNLSMAKSGQEVLTHMAGNKNQFGAMVNQLAFGMEEKVHLISERRDTIALADYVYPRMYGMSNNTAMLFVYPRDKKTLADKNIYLTIEDLGLATGEVGFKLATEVITNEPQLIFN